MADLTPERLAEIRGRWANTVSKRGVAADVRDLLAAYEHLSHGSDEEVELLFAAIDEREAALDERDAEIARLRGHMREAYGALKRGEERDAAMTLLDGIHGELPHHD